MDDGWSSMAIECQNFEKMLKVGFFSYFCIVEKQLFRWNWAWPLQSDSMAGNG